jgi:hypothetical protein
MFEMPAMLWRAFCGLGGADEGEEGMTAPSRADFDTVESVEVTNQTSCLFYDLSFLSKEEFERVIAALRDAGLLDDEEA